jgi:hypothetical protein
MGQGNQQSDYQYRLSKPEKTLKVQLWTLDKKNLVNLFKNFPNENCPLNKFATKRRKFILCRTVLARFKNLELLNQGQCCISRSICFWDSWIRIRIHKFKVSDQDNMKILYFFYFCWSFLPSWIRIGKNRKKYRIFMF